MNAIEMVRQDATGTVVLAQWLGHGGNPVPIDQAEGRSAVCLECPEHRPGKWWEVAKHIIARVIKRQLEVRKQIGITLSREEELGMCKACGCAVRLKCHVPINFIAEHTTDETKAKLAPACWILKEINEFQRCNQG